MPLNLRLNANLRLVPRPINQHRVEQHGHRHRHAGNAKPHDPVPPAKGSAGQLAAALKSLESRQLIEATRGCITIRERAKLEEIAGRAYSAPVTRH